MWLANATGTARAESSIMQELDVPTLANVTAGTASDFGRCGPGSSWKFLGNVYTPECACHDAAVRGAEASGSSHFMAHLMALPKLPAAIGSYVRAVVTGH
jgi:hypothetical protein